MANELQELLKEIKDERLRSRLSAAVAELRRTKKFGLVFEEHIPELLPIYSARVRAHARVARRDGKLTETFVVQKVTKGVATVDPEAGGVAQEIPVAELVVVKRFGEAIFPALRHVESVLRGGDAPHHTLIEADNYHALQLLEWLYAGKVDCIYIDPPYNTGARDWKYNNNYVDRNDSWRHSKWLAMMKRRVALAFRLLKPDGMMCITIDDYEYAHLLMLLEDFRGVQIIGTVPIKNKPQGRPTARGFSVNHEYAVFVAISDQAEVGRLPRRGSKAERYPEQDERGVFTWANFRKSGSDSMRGDRPKQFYPLYVKGTEIRIPKMVWDATAEKWIDIEPKKKSDEEIWPIDGDGTERVWTLGCDRADSDKDDLKVLRRGAQVQIHRKYRPNQEGGLPGTWWDDPLYSASESGTKVLQRILSKDVEFAFPKSLYATADCLRACGVGSKRDALVVDFFAGSGTTLHSLLLLNQDDGGTRRGILVTNNEVGEERARALDKRGIMIGDARWEAHGICRSITWPRCKYVISGKRDDGSDLTGDCVVGHIKRPMKDGFAANLDYLRLDFLDRAMVETGGKLADILPALWMMAGCRGKLPTCKGNEKMLFFKDCPFAVLVDESAIKPFLARLEEHANVDWAFLVTNDQDSFSRMCEWLPEHIPAAQRVHLWRNYVDNFLINVDHSPAGDAL